ncbi:TfoX domain containing protein [Pseudoduganella sp. FT55W]|uniref:TfoX domain containing protein n=1 Tax=Duganella rivi TaxID=2666083 RepID=A0A7X4GT25_9BURK|nr:TfoX/Sxy family protein [Duganella rivi]MYM68641.1 TfoX domain containing protein [Duganella rivi]
MAANAEFVSYIKEQLAPLGFLSSGRFFGGHAISYHGQQFAWVIGSTLYLRVNDSSRPQFEAAGSHPFTYTTKKGEITVRKFYTAPEFLLDDPEQLLSWSRLAIEAAAS